MDKRDAERLAHEKPPLRRITIKTPFAFYALVESIPYKIIAQEGEYCTFQELTAMEAVHFMQERLRYGI